MSWWGIWGAPSDRDYYEQFNPETEPDEDPDNWPVAEVTGIGPVEYPPIEGPDDDAPF